MIEKMSAAISAAELFGAVAALLVGIGLYGLIMNPQPLRKILSFNVIGNGVFLLFGAIAINYSQNQPNWVWLPVAVLASASWVSYIRAKAESLGFDARGGLVERAERFVIFLVALLFPVLMIPALLLMVVLNVGTAVQRFVKVWKQASAERPPTSRQRRRPRRSEATMAERWQIRRDARDRRLASRR